MTIDEGKRKSGWVKIDPHILNEARVYSYIHTISQKLAWESRYRQKEWAENAKSSKKQGKMLGDNCNLRKSKQTRSRLKKMKA